MSLKYIYDILQKIASTTKTLEKIKIIREYMTDDIFKKVIFYALDYNKVFNITKLEYIPKEKIICNVKDIFKFLDVLSEKNGITNEERKYISRMSSCDLETNNVVERIVKKDLRCGASVKTFLKVFHDLPYFEMMTCQNNIDNFLSLVKKDNASVYWSVKKDGVRTWAINSEKDILYLSRSGRVYFNFDSLNYEIRKLTKMIHELSKIPINTPIDGEMIVSTGGFQETMKHIRTLREEKETDFQFNVFDIAIKNKPFTTRYELLQEAFKLCNSIKRFHHISLIKHEITSSSKNELIKLMNHAIENGEEGIVLKSSSSPYEFREKSKYWCKMKPVETYDLIVTGVYMGKKGKKFNDVLGGLTVKFNDKIIRVGTGFSDMERETFLKNPPKLIEVACKGITNDGFLREPSFIRVRNDKLSTSDNS